MFVFGLIVGLSAGGSLIWFAKDKIMVAINGAASFAASLEAKAAALKAKI